MEYETQRKLMVEEQLMPRGITDKRVLDAFLKVQRHKFVGPELGAQAYADHPLPIGNGQTISQPFMAALMTQVLELTGREKVLEIGVGSGYQTAILAELAGSVYAIEWFPDLAEKAKARLAQMGYADVNLKSGNGALGWPEEAPFDRILIAAAAPAIPQPLLKQLNEGGMLVMPVGMIFSQVLTVARKIKGKIEFSDICDCVFVPLLGGKEE